MNGLGFRWRESTAALTHWSFHPSIGWSCITLQKVLSTRMWGACPSINSSFTISYRERFSHTSRWRELALDNAAPQTQKGKLSVPGRRAHRSATKKAKCVHNDAHCGNLLKHTHAYTQHLSWECMSGEKLNKEKRKSSKKKHRVFCYCNRIIMALCCALRRAKRGELLPRVTTILIFVFASLCCASKKLRNNKTHKQQCRAGQQAKGTRVERDQLRNQTIFTFRERRRAAEREFFMTSKVV